MVIEAKVANVDSPYNRFNSFKILAHSDKLRQVAEGGMPYPIDWHIYPSNICNHSCSWCMFRQNGEQFDFPVQLPKELLFKGIRDAHRTGARFIEFSGGGEPLLNKHTLAGLELASSLGISVGLTSNGSLMRPEVARVADTIRVSLNAGTRAQHDKTNHAGDGKTDWDKIIANLYESVPHRKKDFGLGFVVDYDNYGDILPFAELAADIGVDFVHIRPAFWYDNEKDAKTRHVMTETFQLCQKARELYGHRVAVFAVITEKFDGYWTERTYDRCRAVLTGTVLRATGDFAVCQDRTDLNFGGDYKMGATFEEVWHSQEHRELVDSIVSPGILNTCPRCVWNRRNEIIENVFVKDEMRLDLV